MVPLSSTVCPIGITMELGITGATVLLKETPLSGTQHARVFAGISHGQTWDKICENDHEFEKITLRS